MKNKVIKSMLVCTAVLGGLVVLTSESQAASKTTPTIQYQVHVQDQGWKRVVADGTTGGTTGQGLRAEAISVSPQHFDGDINVQVHVKNKGWMPIKHKGQINGTTGQALQMEAIRMNLTGMDANHWKLQYRAHVKNKGWLPWKDEGKVAGTTGEARQLEAVQIRFVEKGAPEIDEPVIKVKNMTINRGEKFDPSALFVEGTNEYGELLDYDQLKVTGSADTDAPGKYPFTFKYKNTVAKATLTVTDYQTPMLEVTPTVTLERNEVFGPTRLKELFIKGTGEFGQALTADDVKFYDEKGNEITEVDTSRTGNIYVQVKYENPYVNTVKQVKLIVKDSNQPEHQNPVFNIHSEVTVDRNDTFGLAQLQALFIDGTDEFNQPLTADKMTFYNDKDEEITSIDTTRGGVVNIKVAYNNDYLTVIKDARVIINNHLDEGLMSRLMLDKVNEYRNANGVASLTQSDLFTKAAKIRATEIADNGILSSMRPNGTGYETAATDLGWQATDQDLWSEIRLDSHTDNDFDYSTMTEQEIVDLQFTKWRNSSNDSSIMAMMLKPEWKEFGYGLTNGYAVQWFHGLK